MVMSLSRYNVQVFWDSVAHCLRGVDDAEAEVTGGRHVTFAEFTEASDGTSESSENFDLISQYFFSVTGSRVKFDDTE